MTTNEGLYAFWCLYGNSEIFNDEQDISFAPIETLVSLTKIMNTSHELPLVVNDSVYHLATLWKSSETEIIILYDPNNESLISWDSSMCELITSRSDAVDLTMLILEGKSTCDIHHILFKCLKLSKFILSDHGFVEELE